MSKERYQWYMGTSGIIDNKTKKFITQDCSELLNKQSKQISDLEAKLAESEENCFDLQQRLADKEEQCRECKHLNKKIELNIKNKLLIENEQLKQQLAEKDDEITQILVIQERDYNQDKISFCIEQLEEVKAVIKARLDIIEENYSEDFYDRKEYIDMSVENDNILKAIDNQIKQLKEMK